ncbi:rhodanese-like domain-containing protein [Aeromicrobium alkaliterrae]|uniref:rhodanese-like domain-containing protein n=1 Tax=Aeromicrobium alkaliterrae TaxID=302168 RepID=UPI0031D223E5
MSGTFASVDALLDHARSTIDRYPPAAAARLVEDGAQLVDIRPAWQREADGEIPGSLIVERNHLEWRLHPDSGAAVPQASHDQQWIVVCTEGYTSSLAAAALTSLGLRAGDLEGGLHGWRDAGLPVVAGPTAVEQVVTG